MERELVGTEVICVCFDYAVTLRTDRGTTLRIETLFAVSTPDGAESVVIDPSDPIEIAPSLVGLVHQRIVDAAIDDDGTIALVLQHGLRLTCGPDGSFEAWTLVSTSGAQIVSLPGGGLARWSEPGRPQL